MGHYITGFQNGFFAATFVAIAFLF